MRWLWKRSVILGVTLVVLILVVLYAVLSTDLRYSLGLFTPTSMRAEYDVMTFSGDGSHFKTFTANGGHPDNVPLIVVEIRRGEKLLFLGSITCSDVANVADRQVVESSTNGGRTTFYFGKSGCMVFEMQPERILSFTFDDRDDIRISRQGEYEFVALPIDNRTLVRAFGRPKRYRYNVP